MYKITACENLIYAPTMVEYGYTVTEPKLTKERGKAGSLEFYMPGDHPEYNNIQKLKTILHLYSGTKEIFRGRCTKSERNFKGQKKIYAEGALSFLLDTAVRPYTSKNITNHELLKKLINEHNAKVDDDKKFIIGNLFANVRVIEEIESKDYPGTLDEITDKILEESGGYLSVRYKSGKMYLDFLKEGTEISDQTIEFGYNLLDLTEYVNAEEIYTVVIPLGKTDEKTKERLTIKSVNEEKDYLENTSGINIFGRIEKVIIFDELEDAAALKGAGSAKLSESLAQAMNITVKAVDMHIQDSSIEALDTDKDVQIISKPHGVDQIWPCTKIVININDPSKNSYSFGSVKKTLSSKISKRK